MRGLCTTILCLGLSTQALCAQDRPTTGSNNNFGWSVFNELQKTRSQDQNLLFSPLSAWLALTLSSNGGEGATLKEFTKVLAQENWTRQEANEAVRATLDSLLANPSGSEQLKIANALWVNQDVFELSQNFAQDAETFYRILPDEAIVRNESFSDPQTLSNMNQWVSRSTDGLIPKILDKLQDDMAMIVLNALYFEAQWHEPFTPELTRPQTFHKANGQDISVPMMRDPSGSYRYAENANYKMLSLSFRANTSPSGFSRKGRFALELVLPAAGSTDTFTQAHYESLLQSLGSYTVNVEVPRFKFDYTKSLVESLSVLGLRRAFAPEQADFTGLGQSSRNTELFISDVLQKTAVEVDENGFKAAAVTSVSFSTTSAPFPERMKAFVADRPFYFILRDTKSGLILFQGMVQNPSFD